MLPSNKVKVAVARTMLNSTPMLTADVQDHNLDRAEPHDIPHADARVTHVWRCFNLNPEPKHLRLAPALPSRCQPGHNMQENGLVANRLSRKSFLCDYLDKCNLDIIATATWNLLENSMLLPLFVCFRSSDACLQALPCYLDVAGDACVARSVLQACKPSKGGSCAALSKLAMLQTPSQSINVMNKDYK